MSNITTRSISTEEAEMKNNNLTTLEHTIPKQAFKSEIFEQAVTSKSNFTEKSVFLQELIVPQNSEPQTIVVVDSKSKTSQSDGAFKTTPEANSALYSLVYAFPKIKKSWQKIEPDSVAILKDGVSLESGGTRDSHPANQNSIPKARLAFVTEMVENSQGEYLPVEDHRDVTSDCFKMETGQNSKGVDIPEGNRTNRQQDHPLLNSVTEKSKQISNGYISETDETVGVPSSKEASVDRPSVLQNRDQTKELWENRMMANEQPISSEIISDTNNGKGISKKLSENGNCVLLPDETETEKENTTIIKEESENSEVVNEQENDEVDDSEQHEEHVEFSTTKVKDADLRSQTGEIENDTGLEKPISHKELNHSDAEGETVSEDENNKSSMEITGENETLEFSGFSADIKETSEVEQYFKAVATCTLSECNKYTKISEVEFEDSSHLDCNDSLQDASETQEKDSLEVSIDSDYGEHSEHEENDLHEEIYRHITANHEVSEVEINNTQNLADVSCEDSRAQHFNIDGEDVVEKYIKNHTIQKDEIPEKDFCAVLPEVIDDINRADQTHSVNQMEESNKKKNEKQNGKVRPSTLGVQKTEQPYNTCTTETKIAMEIREMREREEELKLMREKLMSPVEGSPSPKSFQIQNTDSQRSPPRSNPISPEPMVSGPGYRVSSVFGHKGAQAQHQQEEEKQLHRSFNKENSVEKEIRLARSREEELRREKGLPPREDDSYVKPSQVKSSQVRVFSKVNPSNSTKEMATAKIQMEIEEQTMREMTLRDTGRIQTISQERTDSKVAKLKDLDIYIQDRNSPTLMMNPLGNGAFSVMERNGNGTFSDHSSKRSTPSPTGSSQGIMAPVSKPPSQVKGVNMQRFIASRGKETTFSAPRNGPLHPQSEAADASRSNLARKPTKRVASVESKIQREILEMKLREEELRRLHSAADQSFLTPGENGTDQEVLTTSPLEYENSPVGSENDETCPPHNILIAKWEQRIQKSEGKA